MENWGFDFWSWGCDRDRNQEMGIKTSLPARYIVTYTNLQCTVCMFIYTGTTHIPISSFAYHGCTYFMWIFWCVNTYDFPHLAWTSMTASFCLVITSHVSNVSGMASHSHIFSAAYIHCRGTSIIYISNIELCIYICIWKYRMIVVP